MVALINSISVCLCVGVIVYVDVMVCDVCGCVGVIVWVKVSVGVAALIVSLCACVCVGGFGYNYVGVCGWWIVCDVGRSVWVRLRG